MERIVGNRLARIFEALVYLYAWHVYELFRVEEERQGVYGRDSWPFLPEEERAGWYEMAEIYRHEPDDPVPAWMREGV